MQGPIETAYRLSLINLYRDAWLVSKPDRTPDVEVDDEYNNLTEALNAGFTAGVRACLEKLGCPLDSLEHILESGKDPLTLVPLGDLDTSKPAVVMTDNLAGPLMNCERCHTCESFPDNPHGWTAARRVAEAHNTRHAEEGT